MDPHAHGQHHQVSSLVIRDPSHPPLQKMLFFRVFSLFRVGGDGVDCARDGLITRKLRATGSKGRAKNRVGERARCYSFAHASCGGAARGGPGLPCGVPPTLFGSREGGSVFRLFSADSAKKRERSGRARRRGLIDSRWRRRSRLDRASGGLCGQRKTFNPVRRFPPPDTGRRNGTFFPRSVAPL